ncbi:hypothetical protein NEOLEDRAFT_1079537 [Neolentinus lepideus HHB14362 ss-1]|uniref:Uncharacterized protein n=1 Tax=Neolentinus lepideus HHB14362 ss-1 TaxID=1314782 RepID=A0A165MRA3_9AGAM|nr:hypothetical protein NEOLEDRAFT_1079537 [Neolentinus lepideus HHB14362 ss-1]
MLYNSTATDGDSFDSSNLDEIFYARTPTTSLNLRPTPAPTGDPSSLITVHVTNQNDFSLLMPKAGELISDAEHDGSAFCTPRSEASQCSKRLPDDLIRAAAVERASDGSWVQVTGCMDSSKYPFAHNDDGGQFDVRFPNGAQCTLGGYGASFIELVEPSAGRFCLRCCSSANDQQNCNSHQDQSGCPVAVPGQYDFPEAGVHCS